MRIVAEVPQRKVQQAVGGRSRPPGSPTATLSDPRGSRTGKDRTRPIDDEAHLIVKIHRGGVQVNCVWRGPERCDFPSRVGVVSRGQRRSLGIQVVWLDCDASLAYPPAGSGLG